MQPDTIAPTPTATALSPLHSQLLQALDLRGIRATWVRWRGAVELRVKPSVSMHPSTGSVTFDHPADLRGWKVIGWRVGTMQELKIARPVIWQICAITRPRLRLQLGQRIAAASRVTPSDLPRP